MTVCFFLAIYNLEKSPKDLEKNTLYSETEKVEHAKLESTSKFGAKCYEFSE